MLNLNFFCGVKNALNTFSDQVNLIKEAYSGSKMKGILAQISSLKKSKICTQSAPNSLVGKKGASYCN